MKNVAVLMLLLLTAACGSNGSDGGAEVVMELIAFKPAQLEVSPNASVTWKQHDAGFHTVTSGTVTKEASGSVEPKPDGTFASGKLAKAETFRFTFDDAGVFRYFCEIHPATMSGTVSVR